MKKRANAKKETLFWIKFHYITISWKNKGKSWGLAKPNIKTIRLKTSTPIQIAIVRPRKLKGITPKRERYCET